MTRRRFITPWPAPWPAAKIPKIRRVGGAQADQALKNNLVKVTKESAEEMWERGYNVMIVGSNVSPFHFFGGWNLAQRMPKLERAELDMPESSISRFDRIVNYFNSHLEPELGRHPAFFVNKYELAEALKGHSKR